MLNEKEVQEFLEETGRTGGIIPGLDAMEALMKELGDVQDRLNTIHVAGTNGKGSVCAMLSSVLQEAGYRTGMYTSPAVFHRREQYQVNGAWISPAEFTEVVNRVKEGCDRVKAKGGRMPTVFEIETAAAFLYFYRKRCQVVVLETGMGGEEDATNIIRKPLVSVLTSISMDHMKFLGNSLEEIARKKAGIVKEGGTAVALMPPQAQVRQILEEVCERQQAVLSYAEPNRARQVRREQGQLRFFCEEAGEIRLSMTGGYQVENAVCVLETVKVLREAGWEIPEEALVKGLGQARWEGRFSAVCQKPLFLLDGAHNEDAAKKLRETLKMGFTNGKIIYIIGVLADKEHEKMLKLLLPLAFKVFTVTPDHPRGLDGQVLADEARRCHEDVTCCRKVSEAVSAALALAEQENAVILAFGSLSYLREIKENMCHDR